MSDAPQTLCGRKPFSEKQHKELKKTAEIVAQRPWQMARAASYLKELLAQDVDAQDATPPPMEWALRGSRNAQSFAEPASALLPEDLEFHSERRPAQVYVTGVALPDQARAPAERVKPKRKAGSPDAAAPAAPKAKRTAAKSKATAATKTGDCPLDEWEGELPSDIDAEMQQEVLGTSGPAAPSAAEVAASPESPGLPSVASSVRGHDDDDDDNVPLRRPAAAVAMRRPAAAAKARGKRHEIPESAIGRVGCSKCYHADARSAAKRLDL